MSTTIYVLSRSLKNIRIFLSENVLFLGGKNSVYLNRHVFVMGAVFTVCFTVMFH